MRGEGQVGEDIEGGDGRAGEGGDEVGMDLAPLPALGGEGLHPPGQVGEVEEHEDEDDHPRPAHGAAGVVGRQVGSRPGVVGGAGPPVHHREGVGGVDVEEEGGDEADAEDPQHHVLGHDREQEPAQTLGVEVDLGHPAHLGQEDLEVADQVGDEVTEEDDAGDGHHPLLADGGAVEVDGPGGASAFGCGYQPRSLPVSWCLIMATPPQGVDGARKTP